MNLRAFFLTLLLMLGFSGARATDVGGDIGTDTLWTNAGSPYVVTSNLTVRATLRIESGVRVLVQPGKTILVTGDLLAEGVIFTSSRDQVGSNPAAAPGDWGPLINRLTNENFPRTSNLRGATLRFGKGLQLESASPQLGSLRLENHAAPAISADLRSNPTGDGIVATGNQINGIALPAGNADRGLTLRMRGIPYVITGKLSVGPNPISIDPESLSMFGNQVSEAKVKLLDAAPEGGLSVSLVAAPLGVVTIPSSVIVQANQREAAFNITATQSGGTLITANALGVGTAQATVSVNQPARLQILSNVQALPLGRLTGGRVFLNPVAPAGGRSISLTSSAPGVAQVPASITVPAGQGEGNFSINAASLGEFTLTASTADYLASTTPTLSVRPVTMNWPANLTLPLGTSVVRLQFSDPVPPGGASFTLSSSNSSILTIPATLTAPAGANGVNVLAQGLLEGQVTLTANSAIFGTATQATRVIKVAAQFITPSARIPLGFTEQFQLRLSNPVPETGVVVQLTASDPAVTITPSSMEFRGDSATYPQNVDVRASQVGNYTISAQGQNLEPGSLALSVGPQAKLVLTPRTGNLLVGKGFTGASGVSLEFEGAPYVSRKGLNFAIAMSEPNNVEAPASSGFSSPLQSGGIYLVGREFTTTAALSASSPSVLDSNVVPVHVLPAEVEFLELDNIRTPSRQRDAFEIRIRPPGGLYSGAPVTAQTVLLEIADGKPAGIVAGIYQTSISPTLSQTVVFPANSYDAIRRYVGIPTSAGSYRVQATLQGRTNSSVVQNVLDLKLRFMQNTYVVGTKMKSVLARIERVNGNQPYVTNQAMLITLSSSDSDRLAVVAQVTISANESSVAFEMRGLLPTSAPIQVNASHNNAIAFGPAPPMSVSVVDPQLSFLDLSEPLINGPANSFRLKLSVPGSGEPDQKLTQALITNLAINSAQPTGISTGIYSDPQTQNLVSDVQFASNENISPYRYARPVTQAGSYRVRAEIPGNGNSPWLSEVQSASQQGSSVSIDIYRGNVGLNLYQEGALYLNHTSANPLAVEMISDPPGALEFDPNPVVMAGSHAKFKVIGRSLGVARALVSPPAGFGGASRQTQVVPSAPTMFAYQLQSHEFSINWPGYILAPVLWSVTLESVMPPGVISLPKDLPSQLYGGELYYFLRLQEPKGPGNYRIKVDMPGHGSVLSRLYGTLQNFEEESITVQLGTDKLVSFYGGPDPTFTSNPLNIVDIQFPWIRAVQVGDTTVTAQSNKGTSLLNVSVVPAIFTFQLFPTPEVQRIVRVSIGGNASADIPMILSIVDAVPTG